MKTSVPELGIYIHWPWCTRICPYCDFNVYLAKRADPNALTNAICAELDTWRAWLGPRQIISVFFGGGTPSLIPPQNLARLLDHIAHRFSLAPNAEISLEANPENHAGFSDLVSAGVNRLSLGIQSLRDEELKFLGRGHDANTAKAAIYQARMVCDTVSMDLIYALPGQTRSDWLRHLQDALEWGLDHMSLYTLTFSQKTAFGKRLARGELCEPVDHDTAPMYEDTQDLTSKAGLPAYEISNHARHEQAQCQHNRLYWQNRDWLGLGPGAHGRISHDGRRYATQTPRQVQAYIDAALSEKTDKIVLSKQDIDEEYLIMGLRLVEGLNVNALSLDKRVMDELSTLGLVEFTAGHLTLTRRGRLLADAVIAKLLPA